MKAILISINPKWVAKILNGEKILEIRKTFPKCDLPIDVYIYCTKKMSNRMVYEKGECIGIDDNNNDIILENNMIVKYPTPFEFDYGGKVVAKFTLNKVDLIRIRFNAYCGGELSQDGLCKYACLSLNELDKYLNAKNGYAWYIDNLVIFDKPKELTDFFVYSHTIDGVNEKNKPQKYDVLKRLNKAPQSYCYIKDVL